MNRSELDLDVCDTYHVKSRGKAECLFRKDRDRRTQRFAEGERVKAFAGIERQANRRLTFLETAGSLQAIATYPSNRFEALRGNRAGQYSIRINDQWRICFEWLDDEIGPVNIEIVDYH